MSKILPVLAWLVLAAMPLPGATQTPAASTPRSAPVPGYAADFRLKPLAADPIAAVAKPTSRAGSLEAPSYVDPAYGTRVYKATLARDFPDAVHVRHDYSRRPAFNADASRYLATTSNGYWLLYDGRSFRPLARKGHGGSLAGMAADCEAIWHPTDPKILFFTDPYGGLIWRAKNVETDTDTVIGDFRGRLPWPEATAVWTKGEGMNSADGRLFAFMATRYDEKTKANKIYGLFTWDRVADRIIATLDASAFGGAFPDHVSMSPSGRYVVPSWAYRTDLGTRAYTADFRSFRTLLTDSEHSDLAIGPNGEDLYVVASYRAGKVFAVDLATGQRTDLMSLYPARGASIGAVHVSGQAFDRPGWVVLSTYGDADSGREPDPELRPPHRKVMLLELKPGGRSLSIAHTRTAARYGGYFGEPQATISRDGSRVMFATNFDDGGPADSYLVTLPESVFAP